jgi:SAM-dependent methyltransferase
MTLKTEYADCLICKNSEHSTLFNNVPDRFNINQPYKIVRCTRCDFVYLSPRPVEEISSEFYDLEEYHPHQLSQQSLMDKIYVWIRDKNSQNKRRLIEQYKMQAKILDIGCGTGEFLLEMKKHNWDVTGMETAPEALNRAQEKDLIIFDALQKIPGNFEVISMWHVMEHIYQIADLFEQIKRLLAAGGILILTVPNINSFEAGYYKNNWVALDAPRHLYHFRPVDIEKLLHMNGFEITKISSKLYFDTWYNVLLSAAQKASTKGKSTLLYYPEAAVVGKLSFLAGMFNARKSASPIYIARRED